MTAHRGVLSEKTVKKCTSTLLLQGAKESYLIIFMKSSSSVKAHKPKCQRKNVKPFGENIRRRKHFVVPGARSRPNSRLIKLSTSLQLPARSMQLWKEYGSYQRDVIRRAAGIDYAAVSGINHENHK